MQSIIKGDVCGNLAGRGSKRLRSGATPWMEERNWCIEAGAAPPARVKALVHRDVMHQTLHKKIGAVSGLL